MLGYLIGLICVLCASRLPPGHRGPQLCSHCLAALPWRDYEADPDPSPGIRRQIAPLAYRSYAADWVVRAKHHSGLVEARLLGELLARALLEAYADPAARPVALIPVPLSWQRLLLRGHNQAGLIAEPIHRHLELPVLHNAVQRRRHTRIQPGQSAGQRQKNVEAAFFSRRRWQGEPVAIIDDVLTSGATASALARCLRMAGAGDVHVWCATRADPIT